MQHLFHLHRALSLLIHHTQYIERAEAIFVTGLIHITLLFAYPSTTHRSQQWRNRFRQLHILPHTYHYHKTFFPRIPFTSNCTSTPFHQIVVTTSMATSTSAPPPLAFHTENTTAAPSSSHSRTISQSRQNSPYAIGIPATTFTTTPPFSSHPTTLTITPGSRNTITLPTGCPHSTGPSSRTTSNLKLKDGNLQNIEHTFTPGWPHTNVSFDDYDNANTPSGNHTSIHFHQTSRSHTSPQPNQTYSSLL